MNKLHYLFLVAGIVELIIGVVGLVSDRPANEWVHPGALGGILIALFILLRTVIDLRQETDRLRRIIKDKNE